MYRLCTSLRCIGRTGLLKTEHLLNKIRTKALPGVSLALRPSSNKPSNVYLMDEDSSSSEPNLNVNKFTRRTHNCGELNLEHVGDHVKLCGWLGYQRFNKFMILRDSYGETQLIIQENDPNIPNIESLPLESIIEVYGTVMARPKDMQNKKQTTGNIEVYVEKLTVLNEAKNLPFNIREFQKAKEGLRLKYRYLDLRFPVMQRNLRVRAEILMKMREYLVNHCGFIDVETPTLFKATPGGAQEFVVPTRFPGQFYSLVQSPQQFKQMLMAGAVDRYFQIARCYRDETGGLDRQPEFTQLDIELSFVDRDGIFQLIEETLGYSWPQFLPPLPKHFPRLTYREAMENYGTDKPDLRFDFKLKNCTTILAKCENLSKNLHDFGAYCVVFPKEYGHLSKAVKDELKTLEKENPLTKLVQAKIRPDFAKKMSKLLTEKVANNLVEHLQLTDGSVLFLAYGDKTNVLKLLGKVRLEYVDFLEGLGIQLKHSGMHLLWVQDFPLFEPSEDSLSSAHHPFTAPHPEDMHLLQTSPLQVRSLAFDLVLNGNEIGGGSVRIHDPTLQEQIIDILKLDKSTLQHILEMLSSGCPPHGGIALGIDRIMSKILGTVSIRDVIAFPKTSEGRDLLSGAPSKVSENDLKLYNIKSIDDKR